MLCLFLNDGSGKTLRERDILLYFCNRRNCTTNLLVSGVLPGYFIVFSGPVWKVIVVRIRKRRAKIQDKDDLRVLVPFLKWESFFSPRPPASSFLPSFSRPAEQAPLRIISSMLNDEERKEWISGKGSFMGERGKSMYVSGGWRLCM